MKQCDLAHGFGVNEVVVAPDAGIIVVLPLGVDVQVSEMVTLWNGELLSDLIALLLATLQKDTDRSL